MLAASNGPAPFEAAIMMMSSASANAPVVLPPLVAAYVEATNNFDIARMLAIFADDALVNDQLRDYWGKSAIREWAKRDIIGEKLTMNVTKVINHHENFVVTAEVDGNFDKRGLPDPLELAFYFTAERDLIVQLIILRNRFDI
jgi:SnoaL-like domain